MLNYQRVVFVSQILQAEEAEIVTEWLSAIEGLSEWGVETRHRYIART